MIEPAPYGYCDLAGCNRPLVVGWRAGGPFCECCDPDSGMGCCGFYGDRADNVTELRARARREYEAAFGRAP